MSIVLARGKTVPGRLAAALLALGLLLAGCADTPDHDPTKDWSAARFYTEAREALRNGEFQQAITHYETLESRFPFGRYAQQAQLEVIYAYYRFDEPDAAIAAADRFIKINPLHPYVDYAMYLKGLANFNRGVSFLDRWLEDQYSRRDPKAARQAHADFAELVRRFPDSRYSAEALKRIAYLRNSLAENEIHVARYYVKRQAWVAAVGRAKHVLENFPRTPAVPQALAIMVEGYRALGLGELEADAARVLELNYPDLAGQLAQP